MTFLQMQKLRLGGVNFSKIDHGNFAYLFSVFSITGDVSENST